MKRAECMFLCALCTWPFAARAAEGALVVGAQSAASAPSARNWTVPILHNAGLMLVMRTGEAWLWPIEFARFDTPYLGRRYVDAYTRPPLFDARAPVLRWDHDSLLINVGGHALFGSEAYLSARRCGFSWPGALAFGAVTSTAWEYAIETSGARPSAQDLVYTPLAGMALGEGRYALWKAARGAGPWRSLARGLADPFGELERAAGSPC